MTGKFACVVAAFLIFSSVCSGKNSNVEADLNRKAAISATYVVKSDDENLGYIKSFREIKTEGSKPVVLVTDNLSVDLKSFWGNYSLRSDEIMKLNSFELFEYQRTYSEDGKTSQVKAVLVDEQLVVRINDDGKSFDFNLDRSSYDATSEDAPWKFLRTGEKTKRLKVLNFDDFEIKEITYTNKGLCKIDIANHHFDSHRLHFSSEEKSGDLWLVEDDTGVWLLKENGTDNSGDYTIQLVEYRRESKVKQIGEMQ